MRWLSLLLLLSLTASAEDRRGRFERFCGRSAQGRSSRGFLCDDYAFFEAFPSSGAGTTTACSTTPPTGAKGETLTFTRTGNATCTKTASGGLATSGIANGDLVVLSANQPRVEYDSAGTLGLLVESARTNSLVRSESIDNAVWTSSTGAGAVTVTADYATAPDGTLTADRLQVTACPTIGLYSARLQSRSAAISTDVGSVFLKGTSGSGSIGIMLGGAATYWASTCTFNASTWTRCSTPAGAIPAASEFWIGCLNNSVSAPNPGNTGAADVLVWGAQDEVGAYATSYIPTTSAAVTRNADSPAIFASTPGTVATGSMSLRVQLFTTATNGLLATDATGAWKQGIVTFGGERAYIGAVSMVGPLTALTAGTHTAAMWWDGSSTTLILDGSPTVGAAGTPVATNQVIVGGYNGTNLEPGLYSRVCVDPSPTRCR